MSSFVLKNVKFSKYDLYENPVFIASSVKDAENFDSLKIVYEKIKLLDVKTFLPIYNNDKYNYCNITFKTNASKSAFTNDYFYNITFELRIFTKDGKKFINCVIKKFQRGNAVESIGELLVL